MLNRAGPWAASVIRRWPLAVVAAAMCARSLSFGIRVRFRTGQRAPRPRLEIARDNERFRPVRETPC
jgi:hypothetical protein